MTFVRGPFVTLFLALTLSAWCHPLAVPLQPQVHALLETTRQHLETHRDSPQAWAEMGMVLHAHGFYAEALPYYEQAGLRDPADYRWPYLAAEAALPIDIDRAAQLYAQAISGGPRDHALYIAYGNLLTRLGRYAEATAAFVGARDVEPDSSYANIGLARLALVRGDVGQAQRLLADARAATPGNNEIHTLLAQVHARLGEHDAAEDAAWLARAHRHRLVPQSPVIAAMARLAVDADAWERRGRDASDRGDYAAAEAAFRQVLQLRSATVTDLVNLAMVLAKSGGQREAFELFDAALTAEPDNAWLLGVVGRACFENGRAEQASAYLHRAIRLDPGLAPAHLQLGLINARTGTGKTAIGHLETAVRLDPGLYPAYLDLGALYAAAGDLDAATEAWQTLLSVEPDHVSALGRLADAYTRLGRYTQAVATLRSASDIAPLERSIGSLLARLLASAPDPLARNPREALALATRLNQAAPRDPAAIDLLATAYAASGDFDRAIRLGKRALGYASGNPPLAERIRGHLEAFARHEPILLPVDSQPHEP